MGLKQRSDISIRPFVFTFDENLNLMDLQELLLFIEWMISSGRKHQDYDHVTKLARDYKILMTGCGIEKKLHRFVKRESPEDFLLRVMLTQPITPAVIASIMKPFYKVVRNDRVRKGLKVQKAGNEDKVQQMIDGFFGSGRVGTKGLEYWLKTKKFKTSFADPNAWVVVEWQGVEKNEVPKPYPFMVSASEAFDFEIVNDELQWMFCCHKIQVKTGKDYKNKQKEGVKYTYYGKDFTVVYEQVETKYLDEIGFIPADNQLIRKIKGSSLTWLMSYYMPMIGYPPAFRIGYITDTLTDDRTFVSPFHEAMPFIMKTLKAASELDLTMVSHVFPQKIQFAPPCPGESKEKKCLGGKLRDGETCGACKGVGFITHTAANDVIYLPMPDVNDENVINLENILVYKSPPVELVKFQNDYILQLKAEAHEAVFNSQLFVKNTSGGTGGSGMNTAYEADLNMESIYDTLEAYTEKESELYREIVTVFGILLTENPEQMDVIHVFPADPRLKTQAMLLSELESVNRAQAPSFVRDGINMALAEITLAGDPVGLLKLRVRNKYFPFRGKSQDEIAILMASDFVSRREKVLYANFDSILVELETDNPEFYYITDPDKQFNLLEEKLREWMEAIGIEEQVTPISVDPLKRAAGGADGGIGNGAE